MKFNKFKLIKLFLIFTSVIVIYSQDDELQVNILPSEKYKLNQRDLVSLKSDIERQVNHSFY